MPLNWTSYVYKKPKHNNTIFILKKSYYIVSQM